MSGAKKILVQWDKSNKNWRAEKPGSKKASAIEGTKKEIMKTTTAIAKNQGLELIAFTKKKHQVHIKNSFWNDPCPPVDQ